MVQEAKKDDAGTPSAPRKIEIKPGLFHVRVGVTWVNWAGVEKQIGCAHGLRFPHRPLLSGKTCFEGTNPPLSVAAPGQQRRWPPGLGLKESWWFFWNCQSSWRAIRLFFLPSQFATIWGTPRHWHNLLARLWRIKDNSSLWIISTSDCHTLLWTILYLLWTIILHEYIYSGL